MSAGTDQWHARHSRVAFERAGDLIDANMRKESERSEALLRNMRELLEYARQVYPVNRELAAAFGAKAANRLACAIHYGSVK